MDNKIKNYLKIIDKFIDEMGYKKDKHFLGVYFYGSALTGFVNKNSDIDLHIVFDDFDKNHIFRGVHFIDNNKIEYFEKTIGDLYLSLENDIQDGNIAWYSMLGKSRILYDKNNELKKLQEHTLSVYKNGLPKFDQQDILEYISIIDNRMNKLKILSEENGENFYHLYHITIEKIRRFYHSINGFPKINTSKIYRVYKNDDYRKSYYEGEFVSEKFKAMYYRLIKRNDLSMHEQYNNLDKFYSYVKNGVSLPKGNYRIKIKSRNKKTNQI